jgi:hypothetical protein
MVPSKGEEGGSKRCLRDGKSIRNSRPGSPISGSKSGPALPPVFSTFKYFRIANTRDSYNRPEEVYRLARERGWTS